VGLSLSSILAELAESSRARLVGRRPKPLLNERPPMNVVCCTTLFVLQLGFERASNWTASRSLRRWEREVQALGTRVYVTQRVDQTQQAGLDLLVVTPQSLNLP
jgi:hypothetical protein